MTRLATAKQIVGIASIGLGLTALLFPRRFAAAVGVDTPGTPPEALAAFGSRELANGAGLLAPVKFGPFLWMRVVGDLIDLGGLAVALRKPGTNRRLASIALLAVSAMAVFDIVLALSDREEEGPNR